MVRSISFDMEYTRNKNNERDYYLNNLNEETVNISNFKCAPFIISDVSATIKRIYNDADDYISYGDETMK